MPSVSCHVCDVKTHYENGEPQPGYCCVCKTDLSDESAETLRTEIEMEYKPPGLSMIRSGVIIITTRRLLWIHAGTDTSDDDTLSLFGALERRVLGRMDVDVLLSDCIGLEPVKRGLNNGASLKTKSGKSDDFFINPAGITRKSSVKTIEALAPYITG